VSATLLAKTTGSAASAMPNAGAEQIDD